MNEEFKNALDKDEKLLWSGTPEKFEVADKTHRKGFLTRAIISICTGAVLSLGYVLAAKGTALKPAVFVLLWAICIYAIFTERISCPKVRKLVYGLTDKRAVVLNDSSVHGIEYSSVDTYLFKTDSNGHNCLLVGKDSVKLNEYRWRMLPIEPFNKDMDSGKTVKAGLYAIPNNAAFRKLFEEKVKSV